MYCGQKLEKTQVPQTDHRHGSLHRLLYVSMFLRTLDAKPVFAKADKGLAGLPLPSLQAAYLCDLWPKSGPIACWATPDGCRGWRTEPICEQGEGRARNKI